MKRSLAITVLMVMSTAGCSQESSAPGAPPAAPASSSQPAASPSTPGAAPSASSAAPPGQPVEAGSPGAARPDAGGPSAAPAAAPTPAAPALESKPAYRDVRLPAGTTLQATLMTAVASDSSNIEDPVRAELRQAVSVAGVTALPAGTPVTGHITAAERSARVKGRARVAFRFTAIDPPGDAERITIRTEPVARLAAATKKQDATKIGIGAVGGALIGGIVGGGDGAAKGAAIGGGAGTGVVLATRGKEVRLSPGTRLSIRLTEAVTIRVPVDDRRR
jgi:hypothetical protein